jgi:hypothetical protein
MPIPMFQTCKLSSQSKVHLWLLLYGTKVFSSEVLNIHMSGRLLIPFAHWKEIYT